MTDAIRISRDACLQSRNTFGVAARAKVLVEVADAAALPSLFADPDFGSNLSLVLGGGSNLLFAGDPSGVVLALTGHRVSQLDGAELEIAEASAGAMANGTPHPPSANGKPNGITLVRADAGVQWHDFVMRTLRQGLCGLENLALIPGTVGAAPIQNIGAYGVEVREFIHAVEAFEPATGEVHRLSAQDCEFAYRDSVFKHVPDRYIVTAVEFALSRMPALRLDYAGLGEELAAMGVRAPAPRHVADAVIAIRRRKLPDPAVIGNAGSFFKNPIVPVVQAEALQAQHAALPVFRGNDADTRKLSAGWLIDQCGWKGHREGDAGVAATHALVLVNHGQATGQQLLDLARKIADSVHTRFGVALEPEPRVIGAQW